MFRKIWFANLFLFTIWILVPNAYFQNTFSYDHLSVAAVVHLNCYS